MLTNITDVTNETFQTAVIERSRDVPVLVDYWADWCGPCQMQMPVLRKLVEEHDGRFLLAKVNTDKERSLSREHGIRSLPTMRLYRNGDMVEEILGAQTESTLRIILDRYIDRPSDTAREAALELHRQGDTTAAIAQLEQTVAGDPANTRAALDLIGLQIGSGKLEAAETGYAALPRDVRDEADGTRLRALLDFAAVARSAASDTDLEQQLQADASNMEVRYQLAAQQVLAEDYEAAMDNLMAIIRQDRKFRDDAGRKSLLAVFALLGDDNELVGSYRRKLFNAIH
ncbi:MAG: tetratricopeptide repeat protein [Pseudomonadota bacterium]